MLKEGFRFGPYEILGALGSGGMGEVYRARDARLGRDVAIKVLPPLFTTDAERLARFEREARALASLNHPHIAAIYGVEEVGEVRGLVLELVEGPTLADRLRGGALPVREGLTIARQIADALDSAHERGIVHRDLKPANVKLTLDGKVKVLDFGLAKAADPSDAAQDVSPADLTHSPTMTVGATREGVILGTAAYMSPEQARGLPVGKRTDIWSFGCVLYEMLTGRQAFPGRTVPDLIVAILSRDPDWSALPEATPPSVRRMLGRCLEKEHKQRLRDIGDARMDIEEALSAPATTGAAQFARRSSVRSVWAMAGVLIAIVVAAGAFAFGSRLTRAPGVNSAFNATIERVTRDSGLTEMPALSPDGKLLAYASDRAGRGDLDIWVQQTAGGSPLRLTDDAADDQMPEFSPDGSQVAFRSERANGGVYVVPALGGNPRLVAPDGRWPQFSPDGSRMAYWTGQWRGTPSALASAAFVLLLSGGTPERVLGDFAMARSARWAPDGQSLLVLGRRDRTSPLPEVYDWWWVPLDGRPPTKTGLLDLLDLRKATDQDVVTPGRWTDSGVLFAIRGSIWLIPVSPASGRVAGAPRQLAFGAGQYTYPTISRDGQVAFAVTESSRVIERVPLGDPAAPAARLYSDNGSGASRPSQTADGTTVAFWQTFGRSREIWVKDGASGQQRMVLRIESDQDVEGPVLSPDGRSIGYNVGNAPDGGTGYVVGVDGGVPTQICQNCGVHGFLSDNRRVLVVANGLHEIRLVDVTTSKDEVLAAREERVDRPHASPNDRWLAVRRVVGTSAKVVVAQLTAGRPTPGDGWQQVDEPTTTGRPCGWSLDSRVLYLLLDTDGFRCLWGQKVDPLSGRLVGKPYPVRHFHNPLQSDQFSTSYGNAITADGFLYGAARQAGNIWRLLLPTTLAR